MTVIRKAGAVAGLAALVAGTVAGRRVQSFYKSLDFETGEDERLYAETDDGWQICINRYRARGEPRPFPVVAGHGFAGSHLIWDLTPETSLARHLTAAGYDFYSVDLRGRGESWPRSGLRADVQWSFDDFVDHDLPAAVALACETSGAGQAYWIGLEMSGQALYAAAISGTADQVRGAVTCGSPVLTPPEAKVPGVTAPPQMRRHGRVLFRSGSHYAGPLLALTGSSQLESSFRSVNADPIVPARYLYHGIPDEATVLADQFGDWVTNNTMRSLDHTTVWSDRLDEINLPLLVMAAARDLQRPAPAVRTTFEALGSPDKTYVEAGVAEGFSVDFGHDDLVAGRASPAEVFPRITAWLDDHNQQSGSTDRHKGINTEGADQ